MKYLLIILTFFPVVVNAQNNYFDDFKKLLNEPKILDTQIYFNGFYNEECADSDAITDRSVDSLYLHPLFFFKNGLISYDHYSAYNSAHFKKDITNPKMLKKRQFVMNWGTYKIEGNEIKAIIVMMYWDVFVWEPEATYFSGTIVNKNSIVNWHPVPPFPEIKHGGIGLRTGTSKFYFKPFEDKRLIDSNKVWVNKYRN